jgi:hypothetical protein
MNVKYQIFVSSTYEDLKDERNEVIKACLNMGHIPVGMEMFNAADEEQWKVIARTIDQCDYYVVIVAHRYGSTVDGISFTEKEYDYAIAQSVPVLGFVIEDAAPWPSDRIDKDQASVKALRPFKLKVKRKIVRLWRDKSELQAHFAMSLTTTINLTPRRGWIRAPESTDVDVSQALSNLSEENARLRKELEDVKRPSSQVSYPESIIAALKTIQVPHGSEEETAETLSGALVFREFAESGFSAPMLKDKFPQVSAQQLGETLRKFESMGLFEEQVDNRGGYIEFVHTKATQLGALTYAKLLVDAGN